MKAKEFLIPPHHLDLGDAPGVFHWSRRADRHPILVVLQSRPRRSVAFDQLNDDRRIHRPLDRGSAGLTLTLSVMAVTQREKRPLLIHAEKERGSRPHLGRIH